MSEKTPPSALSQPSVKRYLIVLCAVFGLTVGVVFAFNLLVDPFNCNQIVSVSGFNAIKTRAVGRVAESITVHCRDFDTLVFGTSRVGAGYPATHPAWKGSRFFNFAFDGGRPIEIFHALQWAHRQHRVRRVMIGLDFFMFNDGQLPDAYYNSFINPARTRVPSIFDKTLSYPSTTRSINTVRDNLNPLLTGLLWVTAGGTRQTGYPHNYLFRAGLKAYLNKDHFYSKASLRSYTEMETLRGIMAMAHREGIELRLVINPAHAMMMEVIRYRGFWEEYENWKRELVRVVQSGAGEAVPLMDFTGYNAYTTEAVPGANETERRMKWYLEASHFNQNLGTEVLNRVYPAGGRPLPPAGTFGVRLSPENIEAHLAAIRNERERYTSTHAKEMGWLKELAQ